MTLKDAYDAIYDSLAKDNFELDSRINDLKAALKAEGLSEATFEPSKLAVNNRQGRKIMVAYFRQKGLKIGFAD